MKDFVPHTESLALKELGFDYPCMVAHLEGFIVWFGLDDRTVKINLNEGADCLIPTYSQACRWFRKKYNLVHNISFTKWKGGINFDYDVYSLILPTDSELGDENDIASDRFLETYDSLVDKDFKHNEFDTYEEAELACLKNLIEIVKQQQNETNKN